eukprot:s1524_g5.t1
MLWLRIMASLSGQHAWNELMDLVERRWGGPEAFLAKNAELFRSPKAGDRRDAAFDALDLRSLKKKYKQEEAEEREHLERIEEKYRMRKDRLEKDIQDLQEKLEDELRKLDRLELGQEQARSFHGPRCLRFVEGNIFTVVSTAVVVLNVAVLVKEMTDERYKDLFFWVDQAFLIFYIVELVLRGLLLQKDLLLGPCREEPWHRK